LIFVTIGSGPLDFSRLVGKMDEIARDLKEKVIIQKGYTRTKTYFAESFTFVPYNQALDLFKSAKVIVGHASAGPIIHARKFNKPLIIFPRDGRRNELIDNHQMETAKAIEGSSKMIEVVYHENDLKEAIHRAIAKAEGGLSYETNTSLSLLINYIGNFIRTL